MLKSELNLVVARAQNGVIGCDNGLPWRLPKDLAYFKKVTLGHPIIMGRKTYDSIGKPLPGRHNIVVTRQVNWSAQGASVAHSLAEAVTLAERHCSAESALTSSDESAEPLQVMIIGGANLYDQALAFCERLYLTEVHADVAGDVVFPAIDFTLWRELTRESHKADENNPYDYSFVVYQRKLPINTAI